MNVHNFKNIENTLIVIRDYISNFSKTSNFRR